MAACGLSSTRFVKGRTVIDSEVRAAVKQHIGRALFDHHIPEERHRELKHDPLYVPGEPVNVVDFLPPIRRLDPGGLVLAEAAVNSAKRALTERRLRIVAGPRGDPRDQAALVFCRWSSTLRMVSGSGSPSVAIALVSTVRKAPNISACRWLSTEP